MQRSFTYEGRRYWIRGENELDCIKKIERKKLELELGVKEVKYITVRNWSLDWLMTYKQDVNAKHYKDIERIILNIIEPHLGHLPVKNVLPIQVQKMLNGTRNYSQSYCDKIYDITVQIFRSAWQNNLTHDDITKSLQKPKGRSPQARRALTKNERQVLRFVSTYHFGGLFVIVLYYTGMRPGEAAALDWKNVDLKRRIIHVRQAVKSGDILGSPKTFKGVRDIPIPEPLFEILEPIKGAGLVCPTVKGFRYTKSSMQNMWEGFRDEMCRIVWCPDLTLYCLRHDYCTRLEESGVPINVARDLMGHMDIATTSKIYTHQSETTIRNASKLIDEYFSE